MLSFWWDVIVVGGMKKEEEGIKVGLVACRIMWLVVHVRLQNEA